MTTHDRLVAKWSFLEHGIKQRVIADTIPQTSINYIIRSKNYQNEEKILWLLECIDKHTKEFFEEAETMKKQVLEI